MVAKLNLRLNRWMIIMRLSSNWWIGRQEPTSPGEDIGIIGEERDQDLATFCGQEGMRRSRALPARAVMIGEQLAPDQATHRLTAMKIVSPNRRGAIDMLHQDFALRVGERLKAA